MYCCGVPAEILGLEDEGEKAREQIAEAMDELGADELIVACPQCQENLREPLPQGGGEFGMGGPGRELGSHCSDAINSVGGPRPVPEQKRPRGPRRDPHPGQDQWRRGCGSRLFPRADAVLRLRWENREHRPGALRENRRTRVRRDRTADGDLLHGMSVRASRSRPRDDSHPRSPHGSRSRRGALEPETGVFMRLVNRLRSKWTIRRMLPPPPD